MSVLTVVVEVDSAGDQACLRLVEAKGAWSRLERGRASSAWATKVLFPSFDAESMGRKGPNLRSCSSVSLSPPPGV